MDDDRLIKECSKAASTHKGHLLEVASLLHICAERGDEEHQEDPQAEEPCGHPHFELKKQLSIILSSLSSSPGIGELRFFDFGYDGILTLSVSKSLTKSKSFLRGSCFYFLWVFCLYLSTRF